MTTLKRGTIQHHKALIMIKSGFSTEEIQRALRCPRQAVAAIRAHLTMKTYRHK